MTGQTTVVRHNLLTQRGYTPYCGGEHCRNMPRTKFNGRQFVCPDCGWVSSFPEDFITKYINTWERTTYETDEIGPMAFW